MDEIIVFVFMFVGALIRTILPALRKWKEAIDSDEPFVFSKKYIATFLTSIIVSFLSTITLFQAFDVPTDSGITVMVSALLAGLGLNEGINELTEWIQEFL